MGARIMKIALAGVAAVVAACTLATGPVSAKGGGGTEVSLFASPSCTAGGWNLQVRAVSQVKAADLRVDLYDDRGRVAADVTLVYGVPYLLTVTPAASARRDTVHVFVRGGVQELARYQATNTCAPTQ
jgi:hypothetical protein